MVSFGISGGTTDIKSTSPVYAFTMKDCTAAVSIGVALCSVSIIRYGISSTDGMGPIGGQATHEVTNRHLTREVFLSSSQETST